MEKAIGIRAKMPDRAFDPGASKFFGDPAIPEKWLEDFYEDEIFFAQIRLSDIAVLDKENRLPHTGYLYIFLHTAEGGYGLKPDVRYYEGEPTHVFDEFNAAVDGYEQFANAWLMEFYETDGQADCTRLFGIPSDWGYGDTPPELLMQFDPLDASLGFLSELDGFMYLFFGENKRDFSGITAFIERS
ncbi:MAG: DUF1963 domain-containing protein [Clostridia bacterium]|nr:DUF1963 domain-containing protein [Clostridia bacterium]